MKGKYNFLSLEKVIIRNFSLYSKNNKIHEVNEEIPSGVYCLAGANGLGKTTFLNAINYGLTGIVLQPGKEVFSPGEIVSSNKKYTEKYFSGRIKERNKKDAEIELLFRVNNKIFKIIRGFFEREELRHLEFYSKQNNKKVSHYTERDKSPQDLNSAFQKLLAKEVGFEKFEYFLFYQLYILTFDENRRMIFWDDRASAHTMAIAFNQNPEDTDKIIDLKRAIERHDSNGRNTRWQATQVKNKIEEITKSGNKRKIQNIQKLEDEYNKLHQLFVKSEKEYNNVKAELDTLLKNQSYLNSEIMQLKIQHSKLFSQYSKPRSILVDNSHVQLSLKKQTCCLCGSHGAPIAESIEKNIHKEKCPLCSTSINNGNNKEQTKLLKQIEAADSKLYEKNQKLENNIFEIEGKQSELEIAELDYQKAEKKIEKLKEDYPDISFKGTGKSDIDSLIETYQKQFKAYDLESKSEYKKRDATTAEYSKLLKKIEISYREAETAFVPTFKKLAKSFIGLDLNVKLVRSDKDIKLVLELLDTARTESSQLSESQRFFLDIALRMALSIYLAKNHGKGSMFIDTPEGSLDIAYESRVGNMFAEYVKDYNQNLMITANINASQLLISLAEKCGNQHMKFKRMLDWVDPNPIQKQGEHLFEKVYKNIETALNKNEKHTSKA